MAFEFVDKLAFLTLGERFLGHSLDFHDPVADESLLNNSSWHGSCSLQLVCGLVDGQPRYRLAWLVDEARSEAMFCLYARNPADSDPRLLRLTLKQDLASLAKAARVSRIIGPMESSTWRRYRFVSRDSGLPRFPGEAKTPPAFAKDFRQSGFRIRNRYESRLVPSIIRLHRLAARKRVDRARGQASFAHFSGADAFAQLPRLYALSQAIFANNQAFKPISEAEFMALFQAEASASSQVCLHTATRDGDLLAFAYSYKIGPYGPAGRPTAVLKTIGTHPKARGEGLGYTLSYQAHVHWLAEGCRQMIYPYMETQNVSLKMARLFSQRLRSYVLLERRI